MLPLPQEIENLEGALAPLRRQLARWNTLTIAPGTLERQYKRARHCMNTLLAQIDECRSTSRREEYTYAACGVTGTLLSVALTVSVLTQVVFAHRALAILTIFTTCFLSLTSVVCSGAQLATLYSNHQIRNKLPTEEIDPNLIQRLDAVWHSLDGILANGRLAVASPIWHHPTPNPL